MTFSEAKERAQEAVPGIAHKFAPDDTLAEDCIQEGLCTLSEFTEDDLRGVDSPESYLRQAVKFAVLAYLQSYNTGPWYVGRTVRRVDPISGERVKVREYPRYVHMRVLTDAGVQIDTEGNVWPPDWNRVYGHCYHVDYAQEVDKELQLSW